MASPKVFGYFIIPLLVLFVSTPCVVTSLDASTLCIKEERVALLKIKNDLKDPDNSLSSWVGKDCCNWMGIECHNQTGHVLKLDLSWSALGGDINPSITDLKHLSHLDLSGNNFGGIPIPKFIGSLNMLRYLDLSIANFSGMIPSHLGNLSNLHYLDITTMVDSLWVRDVSWLSTLSFLQYLRMDYVNIISTSDELFRAVIMMPSLLELHLKSCNLRTLPTSLPFENITSPLSVLDLSVNPFNSSIPSWLFNFSNLTELNLYFSSLRGPLPVLRRGNLCKLQNLDLSNNDLTGDIAQMLDTLSSCSNQRLESLVLGSNHLTGKLPHSVGQFNSLLHLSLSNNSISGPIPTSIGNLSNLISLELEGNMMNGKIPESIGQLTQLAILNLLENNWEGTMTNIHFHNLTNLRSFSVSSKTNSFAFKMMQDWIPSSENLDSVELRDCQVGPTFPNWLRNKTSLEYVILENVGISGEIPHWLYNMSSQFVMLDLSRNKISGHLPKILNFSSSFAMVNINLAFNQLKGSIPLWSGVTALDLSNNLLSGTVPTNIGEEMSNLTDLDLSNNHLNGSIPLSMNRIQYLSYLDLSNNYLTGSIPLSINKIQYLLYLDLSNNYLTGAIPVFWMSMKELRIIDLSNNGLSGGIPTSICSPPYLFMLELSNNNLSADLSSTFQNCTRLQTLSLGNNRFYGSLPKEITKNLPLLSELLLRGNTLTGSIPEELCGLPFLHLLDLAENKLSGSIPTCLGDVHGFKLPQTYFIDSIEPLRFYMSASYRRHIELTLKGRKIEYKGRMVVHSTIDLSNNDLCGKIPDKLAELIHLGTLNLSWNKLTGNIPNNIGSLTNLESLDLSHNLLSGSIPASMASMTFLSYLNLSYNNLSGEIPVANQFGTFNDPSIYVGNPQLCGNPLANCSSSSLGNGKQGRKHEEDDDKTERLWLYGSIALGYITGFWLVCGSLVLKRSWRHAYFKFVFDIRDKLLVWFTVNLARAKRRRRGRQQQ